MMDRRSLLAGGATMIGALAFSRRAFAATPSLQAVARDAWLYSVPLVEVTNVRRRILAAGPANTFVHNRDLTNVKTQKVTAPNNDTMYSRAMLDLRGGPVEDRWRIEVVDHGLGVPEKDRERVFAPLARASEHKDVEGHGIGLATVRRIIDAHRGRIGIAETPGGGATVWIELPQ